MKPRAGAILRSWDERALRDYGIPGIVLMENAGAGAARRILELMEARGGPGSPFHLLCGPGNNGGDGFVVARHLHNAGLEVRIIAAPAAAYRPGSDAATNLEIVRRMRLPLDQDALTRPPGEAERSLLRGGGAWIDALFGTGLSRPIASPYLEWVNALNGSGASTIALDVPSGLDADTGRVLGAAVRADHTITFAAPKLGFDLGRGPEHAGKVHVVDIGIPREIIDG